MFTFIVLSLAAPPQFTVENRCPPVFSVVNAIPTPAVVVPAKASGFQSGDYHAGHTCPNCGTQQWRVASGTANVSGHTHTCPSCGVSWWH